MSFLELATRCGLGDYFAAIVFPKGLSTKKIRGEPEYIHLVRKLVNVRKFSSMPEVDKSLMTELTSSVALGEGKDAEITGSATQAKSW